jgi:N6-adenosine-specific RNA methylase IME4
VTLPLPSGLFTAIVADPPWAFQDRGTRLAPSYEGRQRKGRRHYETLTLKEICDLSVANICADDAYLFLWIPTALRESKCYMIETEERVWFTQRKSEAKEASKDANNAIYTMDGYHNAVMEAWGFTLTGAEIVWVKGRLDVEERKLKLRIGGGHYVRNAHETCLIGKRGKPVRKDKGVPSVVVAPRETHSTKPDKFYAMVERLCDGPYVDLYGRRLRQGWTVWGDQVEEP